jgi:hypothetical protein
MSEPIGGDNMCCRIKKQIEEYKRQRGNLQLGCNQTILGGTNA